MKSLALLLALIIFIVISSAAVIEIEVKMKLDGKISFFSLERMNNIVKASTEFYNTGSVAYRARARLDILNGSGLIFSGWSKEKVLMPGERKTFEIYWYSPSKAKNLTARLRIYFGNEIKEVNKTLSIDYVKSSQDIFQIKNFRTYDGHIKFQIRASQSLKDVIVLPSDYMQGWIFEQAKLEELKANKNTEVTLSYEPTVWMPSEVTIHVFSLDGKFHTSKTFELKKEKGIWKYLHYLYDKLSLILNF